MAYRAPAFYFFNASRAAEVVQSIPTEDAVQVRRTFDMRLGELMQFSTDLGASDKEIVTEITTGSPSDGIDTIILSSTNIVGNSIEAFVYPSTVGVAEASVGPTVVVDDPIVEPIVYTLDTAVTGNDFLSIRITTGSGSSGVVPEVGEVMFTQKRTLTRGPQPGWNHPWQRTQNRFVSPGGVSSTWQTGPARKRYTVTWSHLFGADRQIFLDMREQTDDLSQPFWWLPPDDIYPIVFMEIDRDSEWTQDHDSPLNGGTSDEVTLSLIEVLG